QIGLANNPDHRLRTLACLHNWVAPPGIESVDGKLTFDIRGEEGALRIVRAEIQDANTSDEQLERCLTAVFPGIYPVPGATSGTLYRVTDTYSFATHN
ncbi:MAG: hypothetical protein JST92_21275, partial [Deltaproteobacteria bacterium]|nr:hypothetical protein [Deltaproteobacteria bacterium]